MGQDEWSTAYRLRIPVESRYQIFSYHTLTVGSVLPINCNIPMDDGGALVVFIDSSHKGENVGGEWSITIKIILTYISASVSSCILQQIQK